MSAHSSASVEAALRRAQSLADGRQLPLGELLAQALDAFEQRAAPGAARHSGTEPGEGPDYGSLLDDALPEDAHQFLIDQSAKD